MIRLFLKPNFQKELTFTKNQLNMSYKIFHLIRFFFHADPSGMIIIQQNRFQTDPLGTIVFLVYFKILSELLGVLEGWHLLSTWSM